MVESKTPDHAKLTDDALDVAYWGSGEVWPRNPIEKDRRVANAAADKAYRAGVEDTAEAKLHIQEAQHQKDMVWFGERIDAQGHALQVAYEWGITHTEARYKALVAAAEQALGAIHFTREYVGEKMLPAIEGWSWYDASLALQLALIAVRKEVKP